MNHLSKFLICYFIFDSGMAQAASLSLETFVQSYLEQSSKVKNANSTLEQAIVKEEASRDPYKTTLSQTGTWQKNELRSPTRQSADLMDLQTSLTQSLERGMSLSLEHQSSLTGTNHFSDTQPPTSKTSLQLNINSRKFNGAYESFMIQEAEGIRKARQAQLDQSLQTECINAARQFVDAYFQQEILSLYQNNLKDAENLNSKFKTLYNLGQIKKISFLSAQQDYQNYQVMFAEQRLALKKVKIFLASHMHDKMPQQLEKPRPNLIANQPDILSLSIQNSPQIKALEADIDVSKARLALSKLDSQTDFNIYTKAGYTSEDVDGARLKTRYGLIGFKMTLPISDRSFNDAIEIAATSKKIAEETVLSTTKELELSLKQSQATLDSLRTRLRIAQKRMEIGELQLAEAKRLVNLARMDITDYIRDRTVTTNHKIAYLQTQMSELKTLLNIRELTNTLPHFCLKRS